MSSSEAIRAEIAMYESDRGILEGVAGAIPGATNAMSSCQTYLNSISDAWAAGYTVGGKPLAGVDTLRARGVEYAGYGSDLSGYSGALSAAIAEIDDILAQLRVALTKALAREAAAERKKKSSSSTTS